MSLTFKGREGKRPDVSDTTCAGVRLSHSSAGKCHRDESFSGEAATRCGAPSSKASGKKHFTWRSTCPSGRGLPPRRAARPLGQPPRRFPRSSGEVAASLRHALRHQCARAARGRSAVPALTAVARLPTVRAARAAPAAPAAALTRRPLNADEVRASTTKNTRAASRWAAPPPSEGCTPTSTAASQQSPGRAHRQATPA